VTEAIAVDGIGKTFYPAADVGDLLRGRLRQAPVQALTDVSLRVAPGEVLCLMGPNGAGKSTLLRILAGMLVPTVGRAQVLGTDLADADAAFRRRVAFVVGEERSFHWPLSGRQNLAFFAALHGHAPAPGRNLATALLERVGLAEAADRPFSTYSRGMRQRLALARGLLGAPAVVLLDEPTLGLDPQGARDLRHFLRDDVIRGAGRTAVIGTNDPAEARALGDRVLFLDRGHVRGESSPERIEQELGL
jgi:ABC-2 type transport system ATP-binding protein